MGAWALISSSSVFEFIHRICPPLWVTRLITSPTNSWGVLRSTAMIGSRRIGFANLQASSNAILAHASQANSVLVSSEN
jgi:hypothetical protein